MIKNSLLVILVSQVVMTNFTISTDSSGAALVKLRNKFLRNDAKLQKVLDKQHHELADQNKDVGAKIDRIQQDINRKSKKLDKLAPAMNECEKVRDRKCLTNMQTKIDNLQTQINSLQASLTKTHDSLIKKSADIRAKIEKVQNKMYELKQKYQKSKLALESTQSSEHKEDTTVEMKHKLGKAKEEAIQATKQARAAVHDERQKERKTINALEGLKHIKKGDVQEKIKVVEEHTKQLVNFEKAKYQAKVKAAKRAGQKAKEATKEFVKEKAHADTVKYTAHHYKENLDVCQNQVTSCIGYCNQSHVYERTVHSDHTVSYECGGHDHKMQPCNAEDFLRRAKSLQTCADACINEGRCLTFFKNEYNGIHTLCAEIKDQCVKSFCPGAMIKGHLECLITCGGSMCSNIFKYDISIETYLRANDVQIHKIEREVALDKSRPSQVVV